MATGGHENFALDEALKSLSAYSSCLILTHTNPDPDSIAAAEGLRVLLMHECDMIVTLGYTGVIERAENKTFVRVLSIPIRRVQTEELSDFDCVALVDTTPEAGNHMLPKHIRPQIVIDHHPGSESLDDIPWVDVRSDVGASATLVLAYLKMRKIEVNKRLATILLYGIMTDTMDLGRGHSNQDIDAYLELLPRCDLPMLSRIRNPELSVEYFGILSQGLNRAQVYDGKLIALKLDRLPYPDLTAELADFLLRAQSIQTSFCVGQYQNRLRFSMRTLNPDLDASQLAKNLVRGTGDAGGHRDMAGGSVWVHKNENPDAVADEVLGRFLELLQISKKPRNLVTNLDP